jgi:hypothetical protein
VLTSIVSLPDSDIDFYTDVEKFGFGGTNNTNSTFMGKSIPAPALNVTAYYLDPSYYKGAVFSAYGNFSMANYTSTSQEEFFSVQYIEDNAVCQPEPNGTYVWGCSYLILFCFLLFLFFWSLGTWLLWLKANLGLQALGKEPISGKYKAMMTLVTAISEQSDNEKSNLESLSEKQLQDKILLDLNGGIIPAPPAIMRSPFSLSGLLRHWFRDLRSWFQQGNNVWWCIVLLLSSIFTGVLAQNGGFIWVFYTVLFSAIAIAILVGRSDESRLAVVYTGTILFGIALSPAVISAPSST